MIYIDINTDKKITKTLKVDRQLFETEKEVFLYAMSKAYDSMEENELFCSLAFIDC